MGRGGDEGGHLDIPGARPGGRGPRGHSGGAGGQGTNMLYMMIEKPIKKHLYFTFSFSGM